MTLDHTIPGATYARRPRLRRLAVPAALWFVAAPALGEPLEGDAAKVDRLRRDLREMVARARDRVFPALVNIHVITVNYWDGKEHKGRSVGSGTIISREGHVLTNHHVTNQGRKFKCTLADRQEISADLVGEDPLTDLAVLRLRLGELKSPAESLTVAAFGDSDALQVGDHVMAMGSPLALSRSVTLGIVSNTERIFGGDGDDTEEMELEEGQRTGLFTRWIQHDALIHPGNSGGPLVDLTGRIVGINELGGAAIGFAIPSNLARSVAAILVEHGEVARSWIGVSFKPIEKTGLDRGVLVNSVVKDAPAAKAGLQAGDVILSLDGKPVTVRFAEEIPPLMKRIADVPVGAALRVGYERKGRPAEASVVTLRLEKDRGDETVLRSWGITGQEITGRMARERVLETREGVMVSSVRSGGPAQTAEPPLAAGDVIRAIDKVPVADLPALLERYDRIMASDELPEYLLVEFDRGGKNHVTLLKPRPEEDEPPPREVPKAWIGVATQPVIDKLARQLGHPGHLGYRITRVYPGTLAAGADLRVGDIIIALNGEKIRPRGMEDSGLLATAVRRLKVDDTAMLTVLRGGEPVKVALALERTRLTPEEARRERDRDFELTVRELTFFDRDQNRWATTVKGVWVEQVESAGWAGLGGITSGDLIQRIDDHEIKGLKSFKTAMAEIKKRQPPRVVVVVLRGVQARFQYLEPDWKPTLPKKARAGQRKDE